MHFHFAPIAASISRAAVFRKMLAEGLTGCAMSSLAAPTSAQWLDITAPERGVLLGCYAAGGKKMPHAAPTVLRKLLACALFTPRRGKVWEFDFTTFRRAAPLAVPMALAGLAWAFENLECAAVMGLCPAPNRHAWRLAEVCGFHILGRLPQSCWHARKKTYVDGVLVLCTLQSLMIQHNKQKS
jgi:hypothetical protein